MFVVHPWSRSGIISVEKTKREQTPGLNERIDELWEIEQRDRPHVHNGRIYSVVEISEHKLVVHLENYKNYVAQKRDAEINAILNIKPLAVSGLLNCDGSVVFGLRSRANLTDGGAWELVPSGTVSNNPPDIVGQVIEEFCEEIGVEASFVEGVQPFTLIEDTQTGVIDIGCEISVSASTQSILESHRYKATQEYEAIRFVPADDVEGFIAESGGLLGVSELLLRARGYL